MNSGKQPVIAIIGPTAVGKTELSLQIAEDLNAEIISVDSRQVYRYMDVGTDKVTPDTRKRVLHHLIDVVDPDERFTVMDFVKKATESARRITERGKRVIFAGGTPFYYKAIFENVVQEELPEDRNTRDDLEQELEENGPLSMYQKLLEADPVTADRLHPNDTHRVLRALEIFSLSGKKPSEIYSRSSTRKSTIDPLYIGLDRERPALYRRIEERVREQFNGGYVEEVQWLLQNGFHSGLSSMQGFGYREIVKYLSGELSFEDAIQGDIRATKAFSRRQMTWFRKFSPVIWYDTSVGEKSILAKEICQVCHKHYSKEAGTGF